MCGPLPVKLPIKNLPQKIFITPKDAPLKGESLGTVFENHTHT